MLDDLVYHFVHRSDSLNKNDWETPSGIATFPKKIVAAHYLQLVDYMKVTIPLIEEPGFSEWKALQTLSHRCGQYRDDLEGTLLSLGYSYQNGTSTQNRGHENLATRTHDPDYWKDCEADYQYVHFRFQVLKERVDNSLSSMIGLVGIASMEEAQSLKRLNVLAFLFVPLAFTSGLFGMEGIFAPNGTHF